MNWRLRPEGLSRGALVWVVAGAGVLALLGLIIAPMIIMGASVLQLEAGSGCASAQGGPSSQPSASTVASNSIPANYLALFQAAGKKYGVPWVILAGIGKVESDDGQSDLPGVHSGANAFGAAGPMQIGIGGAAGNEWGGAPVHPASEQVNGVATYAQGGYSVSAVSEDNVPGCVPGVNLAASQAGSTGQVPNQTVATAISFAEAQIGKPYQYGGTGPDAYDCSGLVMMAYRAAGVYIPRTSQEQWVWGPQVPASQVEPGDLVFFAGSDGTPTAPGHVGLVIGKGTMIEAYATGYPIRVATYGQPSSAPGDQVVVGFTRPWQHSRSQPSGTTGAP